MIVAHKVKTEMINAGTTVVTHHKCAICGYRVGYVLDRDVLYFDPGCHCTPKAMEVRQWHDLVEWINIQTSPRARLHIGQRIGLRTGHCEVCKVESICQDLELLAVPGEMEPKFCCRECRLRFKLT